jgi:hypothetical protein
MSPSGQTLPSTMVLEVSRHPFPGGQTCLRDGAAAELR